MERRNGGNLDGNDGASEAMRAATGPSGGVARISAAPATTAAAANISIDDLGQLITLSVHLCVQHEA